MQVYDYAYMQRQNIDLIIVPVNSAFESRSSEEQHKVRERLESLATAHGMSGVVVPVWRGYSGRMKFLAPLSIQPVLRQIEWSQVAKSLSGKLALS